MMRKIIRESSELILMIGWPILAIVFVSYGGPYSFFWVCPLFIIGLTAGVLNYFYNTELRNNKPKEWILCAANYYNDEIKHIHQPFNIKVGYVICGQRHHNCIYTFSLIQEDVDREETVKLMRSEEQGFLTNTNRYVDRKEAMKIALAANQTTKEKIHNPNVGLHSEDLY